MKFCQFEKKITPSRVIENIGNFGEFFKRLLSTQRNVSIHSQDQLRTSGQDADSVFEIQIGRHKTKHASIAGKRK